MSVVKGNKVNVSKLTFSDVKTNNNNGKSVYINNGGIFRIQTPVMTLPYDMSVYDGDYPKYTIEVSFRDMEDNPKMQSFHDNMEALDELIINTAVKNSMPWFKKKKSNVEVMNALYNPIVKKSKDKETGEFNGAYPPTMRLKLPVYDGERKYEVFNLDDNTKMDDIEPSEVFTKGTKVQAIIKCGGVWIINGKFGCTWSVEKIKVEPSAKVSSYSFVDEDSDDEEDNKSKSNKTSNTVEDSDEDESDDDDEEDDDDSE